MQIQVLGCSGGIGAGLKTTSFRVNDSVLIDAGTGTELLETSAMLALRHLFITHAHLDHICCLPLMLPGIYDRMEQPLQIHASTTVIDALRNHIFNWTVWPDYTCLPTREKSLLQFREMLPGDRLQLDDFSISAIAMNHPTPTQGYLLESDLGAFAFSGDTALCGDFWTALAAVDDLRHVAIDVSFPSEQQAIANASGHHTPSSLIRDLQLWPANRPRPVLHISHLKPGYEEQVMAECYALCQGWSVRRLRSGDLLDYSQRGDLAVSAWDRSQGAS